MTQRTATLTGFGAVVLWSLLAVLTASTGTVPPFQLAAMTFVIGGAAGAVSWLVRPHAVRALRQPPTVWALGIGGLFGYHALYFAALRLAPPAEAALINYLWPLLIVLFSAFLPGERQSRFGVTCQDKEDRREHGSGIGTHSEETNVPALDPDVP